MRHMAPRGITNFNKKNQEMEELICKLEKHVAGEK